MCGICGFNWRDEQFCKLMADIIKHRGPDDEGFYIDDYVSLGNRRLSIIDIASGHQPMHNEDKDVWIVQNGEIYNYMQLRKELEINHKFLSNSDTEVIIHAYEEWGPGCVRKLNGMWAFCIYDKKRKSLFLSRDRFGIKPLYYYSDRCKFLFASEIKALLSYVEPRPNDEMIYDFLWRGRLEHTENTCFEGIKRILPSTYLILDLETMETRSEKYWDIVVSNADTRSSATDDRQYAERFGALLEGSVKEHLVSDVPVGTCLSGGLDSSSIVCLVNHILLSDYENARESIGERQNTFSAAYEDRRVDEREHIERIVAVTNVQSHYVFPTGKGLFDELESLTYHQDEPFFSTSPYSQWNVMRLAGSKVKVLLDGQGSDELLAGYIPYYLIYFNQLRKERKYFTLMKEMILSADLTSRLLLSSRSTRMITIIKQIWNRRIRKSRPVSSIFREVLNEAFLNEIERGMTIQKPKGLDNLAERSYEDLLNGSLQTLLRYEDRNSMAFSVEARVPFLDHRIIEYVFSVPLTQRIKNGWTKFILRNGMKTTLPDEITKRRSKIGFGTPEDKWLRENKDKVLELFTSQSFGARRYFNQNVIIRRFKEFCEGKSYDPTAFWRSISVEMWLRVFVDEERAAR